MESDKTKKTKKNKESTVDKETTESKQSDICPICQEEFKDQTMIKTLSCMHHFHTECIQKWIEIRNLCPLCNKVADTSRPVRELRDDRQDLSQQMIQNLLGGSMNSTGLNFWIDLLQGRGGILTPMRYWGIPRLQEYLNFLDEEVDNRMQFADDIEVDDNIGVDDEIYIPPQFFSVEEFNTNPERLFSSQSTNSVQNVLQFRRRSLMDNFIEQFLPSGQSSSQPIPEHKLTQDHYISSSRQSSRFVPYGRPPNLYRFDRRDHVQQSVHPDQLAPRDQPLPPNEPPLIEQLERSPESGHSYISCREKAQCAKCYKIRCVHVIKRCGKCKQVRYCNRECQEQDWSNHKTWCLAHSVT